MDLSEVSEELDSNLWMGRLKVVWDSIQPQDWVEVWMPVWKSGWGLSATLYTFQRALRGVDLSREELGELLSEMIDDLSAMKESFPDAGQVFLGIERLDTLVSSLADHPDFQVWKAEFSSALSRLVDDIVSKGLDLLINPQSANLYEIPLARALQTLELIASRVVEELLRSRRPTPSDS